MKARSFIAFCIDVELFGHSVSAQGEEPTVSAMAPWEGDGEIFRVAVEGGYG